MGFKIIFLNIEKLSKIGLKLLLIFCMTASIWACKSRGGTNSEAVSKPSRKVFLGQKKFILVPTPKAENASTKMNDLGSLQKSLLIGKLLHPSYLETKSGRITLTQISMQEATNIETGFFQLGANQHGKYALIKGHWDEGEMVYQAEIVCLLEGELNSQLTKELESGKLTLEDICK